MTITGLFILSACVWLPITLFFLLSYIFDYKQFKAKSSFFLKRFNGKKATYLLIKIIGFVLLIYLVGGTEIEMKRILTSIFFFISIVSFICLGILMNLTDFKLDNLTTNEIRKYKLKRLKRKIKFFNR